MPGPLLHLGASVICAHGGSAMPTAPNPRVQWVVAALRLFSNGQPVVLMDSQAVCVPNGTPLVPVAAQTRVVGS